MDSMHARIHLREALADLVVEAQLQVWEDQAMPRAWKAGVFGKLLVGTIPTLDVIYLPVAIALPAYVMVIRSRLLVSVMVSLWHSGLFNTNTPALLSILRLTRMSQRQPLVLVELYSPNRTIPCREYLQPPD